MSFYNLRSHLPGSRLPDIEDLPPCEVVIASGDNYIPAEEKEEILHGLHALSEEKYVLQHEVTGSGEEEAGYIGAALTVPAGKQELLEQVKSLLGLEELDSSQINLIGELDQAEKVIERVAEAWLSGEMQGLEPWEEWSDRRESYLGEFLIDHLETVPVPLGFMERLQEIDVPQKAMAALAIAAVASFAMTGCSLGPEETAHCVDKQTNQVVQVDKCEHANGSNGLFYYWLGSTMSRGGHQYATGDGERMSVSKFHSEGGHLGGKGKASISRGFGGGFHGGGFGGG